MRRLAMVAMILALFSLSALSGADITPSADKEVKEKPGAVRLLTKSAPGINLLPAGDDSIDVSKLKQFILVDYDFESVEELELWTNVDNTRDADTFFHVDDFDGLAGGDFGGLMPIEGTKSMWCGSRGWTYDGLNWYLHDYLCSWINLPGYGNDWFQMLKSLKIELDDTLFVSYHVRHHFEGGDDYLALEYYDSIGDYWNELRRFDLFGLQEHVIEDTIVFAIAKSTFLRFNFRSDGSYSDQDGMLNTDGAVILDSITVADVNGVINFEDFESRSVGATSAGIWRALRNEGFGLHGWPQPDLQSFDPCAGNTTTQLLFNLHSITTPPPPYRDEYRKDRSTPLSDDLNRFQNEMYHSPWIDLERYSAGPDHHQGTEISTADLQAVNKTVLSFEVYAHLPFVYGVFYYWEIRTFDEDSNCPMPWKNRGFIYYNDQPEFRLIEEDISDLIEEDVTEIQVAVGLIDLWEDNFFNTPAPYYDNVRVTRYAWPDPQWAFLPENLFQDTFENTQGWGRADMAKDVNTGSGIRPGDSIIVSCVSKYGNGIETGPDYRNRIYMHVKCSYIGADDPPKPDLSGFSLEGTYGTYDSDDGTWTIIQGGLARPYSGNPGADKYMFDLNDSLFTEGYMIEYYFKAYNRLGGSSTLPDSAQTKDEFFEFTILPTENTDIIIIRPWPPRRDLDLEDDYEGVLPPDHPPDIFHVNQSDVIISNGLASRTNALKISSSYNKIFIHSGYGAQNMLSDGSGPAYGCGKQDDVSLLIDWLRNSDHYVGLCIMGDDAAKRLSSLTSTQAEEFLQDFCGVEYSDSSYYEMSGGYGGGGIPNPMVRDYNDFLNPLATNGIDEFYLWGGEDMGACSEIRDFDVLEKTGIGQYTLQYLGYGAEEYYAGIYTDAMNDMSHPMKTIVLGFGYDAIRDSGPRVPMIRKQILGDIIEWMGNPINPNITDSDTPPLYTNHLSQNQPNPFNPSTTIRYGLEKKGFVTIRIFDVNGRLVRTLVSENMAAGDYKVRWDGLNNGGSSVASGVYFYRLVSGKAKLSRKMILLK